MNPTILNCMPQVELSCSLCPPCFLCNNPLALLRNDSLCTKTPRWKSWDKSSGRGTIAIRGRPTVEADPVMKVNVERAPSRGGKEWAGPPKQWTQSSDGGRRGRASGWRQLFLINCFHVIDWLLMWWLAGRGASSRHWLNVLEARWWSSWSLHQHRDTYEWAWERAASYVLLFSWFLSFTLSLALFQRSVKTSFPPPSFISVLFMFSIVSIEGGLCWNSSSLPTSFAIPPFPAHGLHEQKHLGKPSSRLGGVPKGGPGGALRARCAFCFFFEGERRDEGGGVHFTRRGTWWIFFFFWQSSRVRGVVESVVSNCAETSPCSKFSWGWLRRAKQLW